LCRFSKNAQVSMQAQKATYGMPQKIEVPFFKNNKEI
jgi:hypothetical protein